MQNTVFRFRCSFEFKERLESMAKKMGLTVSEYIRWIVEKEVKEDG